MIFINNCFAQESEGLRDIKSPVDFSPNYLLVYSFFFILLCLGVFFLVRFFMKKWSRQKRIQAPNKLPHEIAYERLEELKRANFPAQGKIKQYYIVLSDIVRRYLEDQFLIKAPEMTTEEFLYSLNQVSSSAASCRIFLKDFLDSCDLVKFAKYGPGPDEIEKSFCLAKKLIDETRQVEDGI